MKQLSTNYTYSFIYQAMRTCFCFNDYTTVIPYRSQPGRVIGCLTWHRCSWMMLAAKDRIHLQYSELGVFFQFSHMFFIGIAHTHIYIYTNRCIYIYLYSYIYIYKYVCHHFPTSCRSPLRVFFARQPWSTCIRPIAGAAPREWMWLVIWLGGIRTGI
jgi:hypothetical protein